jgi:hypothetical protein
MNDASALPFIPWHLQRRFSHAHPIGWENRSSELAQKKEMFVEGRSVSRRNGFVRSPDKHDEKDS